MTTFGDDLYCKTINGAPVADLATTASLSLTGNLAVGGTAAVTGATTLAAVTVGGVLTNTGMGAAVTGQAGTALLPPTGYAPVYFNATSKTFHIGATA